MTSLHGKVETRQFTFFLKKLGSLLLKRMAALTGQECASNSVCKMTGDTVSERMCSQAKEVLNYDLKS